MRLSGYDYSQPGWYFVTLCTKNRREVFGVVKKGEMRLNQNGKIVVDTWQDLPNHYYCILDECIVMPNHVHGVIHIPDRINVPRPTAAAGLRPAAAVGFASARREGDSVLNASLTEIVRALKSFSSRRINELRGTQGQPVWQRSFYDHVLHGNNDILRVREYIRLNPEKWGQDRYHERKSHIAR